MNIQLKQLRQQKGFSQDEMAHKLTQIMGCEIKVSRYGTWERQDRMMSLEQAFYCCKALGCTLNDLVGMGQSSSNSLDENESKLIEDYRSTHDYFKPEISDYAARQSERHPKKQDDGLPRKVSGELI